MEENGRLVQFLYNEDREVVAEKDCSGNIIRYIRGLGLISSNNIRALPFSILKIYKIGKEQVKDGRKRKILYRIERTNL